MHCGPSITLLWVLEVAKQSHFRIIKFNSFKRSVGSSLNNFAMFDTQLLKGKSFFLHQKVLEPC